MKPQSEQNDYLEENDVNIVDNDSEENEEFRYSITSYGADYTVSVVVDRLNKEKIFLPPFQRNYVWPIQKASRFIESLILGLPVPGVFLSMERDTNRMLIVDGQQRLTTLQRFVKGFFGSSVFALKGVSQELEGKTYETLREEDRDRLDEAIIHATVVKQDDPKDDDSSIFMIFERLNTGGMPLQPQEVRACIYYGKFNDYLSTFIHGNKSWRRIFGDVENRRMKEQELLLRFFYLWFNYEKYRKGMKQALNRFMHDNKNLTIHSADELDSIIVPVVDVVSRQLGPTAFRNRTQVNAAVFDAVMIGLASAIGKGSFIEESFKDKYASLISDQEFVQYTEQSTGMEKSVKGRIEKAINAFAI